MLYVDTIDSHFDISDCRVHNIMLSVIEYQVLIIKL